MFSITLHTDHRMTWKAFPEIIIYNNMIEIINIVVNY